ncbi:MAG: YhcH/YjgK/YiaL family protein [Planctomycetota bacterium]|jgi:YhcH/YjgK/YiaL family protein|nr:YhcH/YjgK/YiaL family protein [Planctomycetota bacterium]
MLYADIADFRGEFNNSRILRQALDFLAEKAPSLPDGRHDLDQGMFALLKRYEPAAKEARPYESHAEMIDLQAVIEGVEIIYCCPVYPDGLKITEDRLGNEDLRYYEGFSLPGEFPLTMIPGLFALLPPPVLHQTECFVGVGNCRKVLIKIPRGLLNF